MMLFQKKELLASFPSNIAGERMEQYFRSIYEKLEEAEHDAALMGQSHLLAEIEQNARGHYVYGDLAYQMS